MVMSISEKFTEENKTEESAAPARPLVDKEGAESINASAINKSIVSSSGSESNVDVNEPDHAQCKHAITDKHADRDHFGHGHMWKNLGPRRSV